MPSAPLGAPRHPSPGDGWVECACGRRHWGLHGAAGLLLARRSPAGRGWDVVLQHRALWSDQGGTWGIPGGARAPGESAVDAALRPFIYLPFMHSENVRDLDRCVALMHPVGGESLRFAEHHRGVVARFGRFPHRNAVLARRSTEEERRFLAEGGFGG